MTPVIRCKCNCKCESNEFSRRTCYGWGNSGWEGVNHLETPLRKCNSQGLLPYAKRGGHTHVPSYLKPQGAHESETL